MNNTISVKILFLKICILFYSLLWGVEVFILLGANEKLREYNPVVIGLLVLLSTVIIVLVLRMVTKRLL